MLFSLKTPTKRRKSKPCDLYTDALHVEDLSLQPFSSRHYPEVPRAFTLHTSVHTALCRKGFPTPTPGLHLLQHVLQDPAQATPSLRTSPSPVSWKYEVLFHQYFHGSLPHFPLLHLYFIINVCVCEDSLRTEIIHHSPWELVAGCTASVWSMKCTEFKSCRWRLKLPNSPSQTSIKDGPLKTSPCPPQKAPHNWQVSIKGKRNEESEKWSHRWALKYEEIDPLINYISKEATSFHSSFQQIIMNI